MTVLLALAVFAACPQSGAVVFERRVLSNEFLCEGAAFGDLDKDGHGDVVAGPYWYAGPDFDERREIYAPAPFDPLHYSDNFFAWTRDFNRDGWLDVLVVGFPGREAFWYENPGDGAPAEHWARHLVFPNVDNEAPLYADLTGDGVPELVFHTGGRFGYAAPDPADARAPWSFRAISDEREGLGPFVHGLGAGDVNGDGRTDLLERGGWFEQPEAGSNEKTWPYHAADFAAGRRGGAQMFADDVDADGDPDVITSIDGHGFGLSWFEQISPGVFVEHRVLDESPGDNVRGVAISQLHALAHADVDGDGLLDIVTGKRWWAHGPRGDPGSEAPADLYWLRLVRRGGEASGEVELVPHAIDHDSGVGTEVTTGDVNGDRRTDVLVANKKGTFLFIQREGGALPRAAAGDELNFDFERGDLAGWRAEGEAFAGQPVRGDTVTARGREPARLAGDFWIGGYELHGDGPTGRLISPPFPASAGFASFLVGGGAGRGTRVELALAGAAQPFFKTSGANSETMQRVVVDLAQVRGQLLEVRLVDESSGGWGHINFDDLRLHEREPRFPRDPRAPAILPADPLRAAGQSPEDARRAMVVPEGFRVDLIAAEPELVQPIAFTIDPKGRIWIAEASSYPEKRPEGEGRDTILVLEDRDADGSYETCTTFCSDLNLVSGLEVGFGGVFVGQAPQLLFLPDRDDDLVPDGPAEVLLDGFGLEDTHETLNSFTWGPDGWLYGCHGVFTHSSVGAPGAPADARVGLNAGLWRFHPTRREFEVFAWGTSNPWGVAFDARGQAFLTACVIPHLYHAIQGGRYQRQAGSHFGRYVYDDLKTIADHRHYLGDTPHGGNGRSDAAGGGHAHCGAMIYQGGAFPAEYEGRIFMANIHGNRLNSDVLERSGSGFAGRHGPDFLLANDAWFRGVALKYGPDGAVYVADWYDAQACHLVDPLRWDRSNGRLYRVAHGAPKPARVDLTALSDLELARLQLHDNEWYARRSRVLLQERGAGEAAQGFLRELLAREDDEELALRALWTLHAVGALAKEDLLAATRSEREYLRAWAVQLLLERGPVAPDVVQALAALAAADSSPVVRLYLASGLQRLEPAQRWDLAAALLARGEDAKDANLPLLIWYGVEPLVALDAARALALVERSAFEEVERFAARRAAAEPESRDALLRAIASEEDAERRRMLLAEALEALKNERDLAAPESWPAVLAVLSADEDPLVQERAQDLAVAFGDLSSLPALLRVVADAAAAPERRAAALEALVRVGHAPAAAAARKLLHEPALRGAALSALTKLADEAAAEAILDVYPELAPDERRAAQAALAARPGSSKALLLAVQAGAIPRAEVGAFVVRQIQSHADAELAALLRSAWGEVRDTPAEKRERIAELSARLTPAALAQADLHHGRALFAKSCQQCHALFGTGGDLGPDLTGSNRRDVAYLVHNLVDPSAEVGRDYRATVAWLKDGRVVTGLMSEETDTSVVLRTESDTIVIARDELEDLRPSELSTMPDGLLDALADDAIRDLVAYVGSDAQVPRLLMAGEEAELFDGATLQGWHGDGGLWSVEDGAITGATSGIGRNAFLRSDFYLKDFRLSLEVLLKDDAGNSGIQFRSRELADGDVAGYQADIGPGWWGKLYEEHGRGVMAPVGGEALVRKGEWNAYEITAVGHRVRLAINGEVCAELEDPAGPLGGILALQIHSGGATEVRFRKLRLELSPALEGLADETKR